MSRTDIPIITSTKASIFYFISYGNSKIEQVFRQFCSAAH